MPVMMKKEVRVWMAAHVSQYEDVKTGEVNTTALAEGAACEFGDDHVGGPLDQPDHWVWELADFAGRAYEKMMREPIEENGNPYDPNY